jgi:hypothetical protein
LRTFFTTHTVHDGKWRVTVWIKQHEGYEPLPQDRPDLRALINLHYNDSATELANLILATLLDCKRVHVETLSGTGVYAENLA